MTQLSQTVIIAEIIWILLIAEIAEIADCWDNATHTSQGKEEAVM